VIAPGRTAVFLDRDGVILDQVEYLNRPEDIRLLAGAAEAIARLNAAGIPVVVITNQAGIAKGYLTEEDLAAIHDQLRAELADDGARLDAIYYCPHHPAATVVAYRCDCPNRKPGIGMLEQARDDLGISLTHSYLVGDMTSDILAGAQAGCRTLLVSSGFGGRDARCAVTPDRTVADITEAVDVILTEVGS